VDIAATLRQLDEFEELTYVIVKHTNACGVASGETPKATYLQALSCDPVSAFGGVIATNREVDLDVAQELHGLFFEVLIAPSYAPEALELLKTKKKRVLIERKATEAEAVQVRNLLGGYLVQDSDQKTEVPADLKTVTKKAPTEAQIRALLFANKIVKHTKSNTIVLATETQLFASGVGQTSRVDALRQAIAKAKHFGFDLSQAVMASDAFFPFPDCVEIAHGEGIQAVIQPGGSIKDQASIDYCDTHDMAMVFTGTRHFLH
jgi:phosphoribosylaminoimidazolecarboxamide formyltransferase/IMP cyclohydrolase